MHYIISRSEEDVLRSCAVFKANRTSHSSYLYPALPPTPSGFCVSIPIIPQSVYFRLSLISSKFITLALMLRHFLHEYI